MQGIATDFIGVTLIAKSSVKAKTFASDIAPDFDSFISGDVVGKIYSYVQLNAVVWWMFLNASGKAFYVKHQEGVFEWAESDNDIIRKNIVNRGGDVTEFDRQIRNKKLTSIGVKIGVGLVGGYILKRVIDTKIK